MKWIIGHRSTSRDETQKTQDETSRKETLATITRQLDGKAISSQMPDSITQLFFLSSFLFFLLFLFSFFLEFFFLWLISSSSTCSSPHCYYCYYYSYCFLILHTCRLTGWPERKMANDKRKWGRTETKTKNQKEKRRKREKLMSLTGKARYNVNTHSV